MCTKIAEGPAYTGPSFQLRLERCDVGSDFHRDSYDFGLGLGPRHGALQSLMICGWIFSFEWVLSPSRNLICPDHALC